MKVAWPGARQSALWLAVLLCSALPLAWVVLQVVANPAVWSEAHVNAYRFRLLLRTFEYSVAAGGIALALSIPVAVVIGRGGAVARTIVGCILPVTLLLPSIVYAYGWSQFLRLLHLTPYPQSTSDISRCIWSLATWLWPVPAVVVGMALRRLNQNVQQHALLDGAWLRITARQLLAPAVVSVAMVSGLAAQEFAVYEPTGISVLATEIRMVYETGALSSPDNPITQPMGSGAVASDTGTTSLKTASPLGGAERAARGLASQSARSGAAVAVALPGLVIVLISVGLAALWFARTGGGTSVDAGPLPAVLQSGWPWTAGAGAVVLLAVVVPIVSLVLSLKQHRPVEAVWEEFSPQVVGSLVLSTGAGIVGLLLAAVSVVRRSRGALAFMSATFLVGGQILAIALVRIYNHAVFESWLYNGPGIVVVAYVARFGWIALLAGATTWAKPWQELRDLAAVDGASAAQTARLVIFPLVWPVLLAAGLFVMILGLTEVPATVLLSPQRPPTFTPMLMQWVHMLRSDPMIEGSLLLVALVLLLGAAGATLVRVGVWLNDWTAHGRSRA